MRTVRRWLALTSAVALASLWGALAQPSDREAGRPDGAPPFGAGGFGPPGFGGPGGMQQEVKLVKQFDRDGNHRLDAAERQEARKYLAEQRGARGQRGPFGRRGGFGGPGESQTSPTPGPKLTPAEVKNFPDAAAYDPLIVRTFFLEFENSDWEKELADFKGTDVEVPAKLTVDGHTYPDVGVHFRGASSFMMLREGDKRSLNLSLDFVHENQNLKGYRTFNLLNGHEDPSFLRTVLYYHVAREYVPAPKANFVRVVINGECWGIYVSTQQFNKDFVKDWFNTTQGARWKVPGSPRGRAGLEYLGDDVAPYRRLYEIKTKDDPAVWQRFILLCKTLAETPAEQLEEALKPLLAVDETLKFLALDNAMINNDGYWIRASDYSIYLDPKGVFHTLPCDANETFSSASGPGFGGGPRGRGGDGGPEGGADGGPGGARGGGVNLDPLVKANDTSKPLLSKLLAAQPLRARYLAYERDIATKWLDWQKLGPITERLHNVIADDVKKDTRKLYSTEAFVSSVTGQASGSESGGRAERGRKMSLQDFAAQRRAYLLQATAPAKQ